MRAVYPSKFISVRFYIPVLIYLLIFIAQEQLLIVFLLFFCRKDAWNCREWWLKSDALFYWYVHETTLKLILNESHITYSYRMILFCRWNIQNYPYKCIILEYCLRNGIFSFFGRHDGSCFSMLLSFANRRRTRLEAWHIFITKLATRHHHCFIKIP